MAHKCTVITPLPTGVAGLTVPSPWGAPGMPVLAGQVLVLDDATFAQIPQFFFTSANSFGKALFVDNGEIGTSAQLSVSEPTYTLAGTTAGSAIVTVVSEGNYKKMVINLEGYQNTSGAAQVVGSTNTALGGAAFSFTPTVGANGITANTFAVATSNGTTVASGNPAAAPNFVWNPATSALTLISGAGATAINGVITIEGT